MVRRATESEFTAQRAAVDDRNPLRNNSGRAATSPPNSSRKSMSDLWRLSALDAVNLLRRREVSALDLVDAAAARIEAVEPHLNAIPTRCIERARAHARRIMA